MLKLKSLLMLTEDRKVKSYLIKYFDKLVEFGINKDEIEHICHYLENYKGNGDILTFSVAKTYNSSKKWTFKLSQKATNLVNSDDDIEVLYQSDDLSLSLVEIKTQNGLLIEGKNMGHCVGAYDINACRIFSVRDSKNKSHATVEACKVSNDIKQLKGKGNKFVVSKYAKFLITALHKLGYDFLASQDLDKLGLIEVDQEVLEKLNSSALELNLIKKGESLPVLSFKNHIFINNSDSFWHK